MKKLKIPAKLKAKFARTRSKFIKNKPRIQTYVGIAGFTATAIGCAAATVKARKVISDTATEVRTIRSLEADNVMTKEEAVKETKKAYAKLGGKIIGLYLPVAAGGVFSACQILRACSTMETTIAGLAAAYNTVNNDFINYRSKVVEEYGAEVDQKLYSGTIQNKLQAPSVVKMGSDGSKVVVLDPPIDSSICDICIDKNNRHWSGDMTHLENFVTGQIKWLNVLADARKEDGKVGYIDGVDIYDAFSIPYTREQYTILRRLGILIYDDEDRNEGDNYLIGKVETVYHDDEEPYAIVHFNLMYIVDHLNDDC